MKIICYLLLVTCYLTLVSCTTVTPYYRYKAEIKSLKEPPDIQVLLAHWRKVDKATITIKGGYQIYAYSPDRKRHFLSNRLITQGNNLNNITIQVADKKIVMGDINLNTSDIVVKPITPPSTISAKGISRSYRGMIRIKTVGEAELLIGNILDIESYLYGVIGSEMDLRYPASALAAQAITSRTFAFFRIKQSHLRRQPTDEKPESEFDLTDDIFSQVYWGEERINRKSMEAVDSTRGVVMEFAGKIFFSIFHDTCGGATEPADLVYGLTLIPPLKGTICGFCGPSKFTNWQATFTQTEIIQKLKLTDVSRIDEIVPLKKGPGGHIVTIGLRTQGNKGEINLSAQDEFRVPLGPDRLRSNKFEVSKKGNTFEFIGHGWGHGVGMCQEGAHGMSRQGFSTLQILEYYYPESKVVKIY